MFYFFQFILIVLNVFYFYILFQFILIVLNALYFLYFISFYIDCLECFIFYILFQFILIVLIVLYSFILFQFVLSVLNVVDFYILFQFSYIVYFVFISFTLLHIMHIAYRFVCSSGFNKMLVLIISWWSLVNWFFDGFLQFNLILISRIYYFILVKFKVFFFTYLELISIASLYLNCF